MRHRRHPRQCRVEVELPQLECIAGIVQLICLELHEETRRTRWRLVWTVEIGRQHAPCTRVDRVDIEVDARWIPSSQHRITLERDDADTVRSHVLIGRHGVRVRPHAPLRIVIEDGLAVFVLPEVPTTRRVTGGGGEQYTGRTDHSGSSARQTGWPTNGRPSNRTARSGRRCWRWRTERQAP